MKPRDRLEYEDHDLHLVSGIQHVPHDSLMPQPCNIIKYKNKLIVTINNIILINSHTYHFPRVDMFDSYQISLGLSRHFSAIYLAYHFYEMLKCYPVNILENWEEDRFLEIR